MKGHSTDKTKTKTRDAALLFKLPIKRRLRYYRPNIWTSDMPMNDLSPLFYSCNSMHGSYLDVLAEDLDQRQRARGLKESISSDNWRLKLKGCMRNLEHYNVDLTQL